MRSCRDFHNKTLHMSGTSRKRQVSEGRGRSSVFHQRTGLLDIDLNKPRRRKGLTARAVRTQT